MKAFTVEWVLPEHIMCSRFDMYKRERVPVVRLAEVDAVIQEAVWAMEKLLAAVPPHGLSDESFNRIQAFLEGPNVAAWLERQEGKS